MIGKNMEQHHERQNKMPVLLSEAELSSIVEAGGGRYVGVQNELHRELEPLVLFISPRTRTTLGIPISGLTVRAVREQMAESDAAFNEAGFNEAGSK
jgi:hypothetical protein